MGFCAITGPWQRLENADSALKSGQPKIKVLISQSRCTADLCFWVCFLSIFMHKCKKRIFS